MRAKKTYAELMLFESFEDRLRYLLLRNEVGRPTMTRINRYWATRFYNSTEWLTTRNEIIVRDGCCDIAVPGRDIYTPYVHHIMPIDIDDITRGTNKALDHNNLICVSYDTHNMIHYGGDIDLYLAVKNNDYAVGRKEGDTKLWR